MIKRPLNPRFSAAVREGRKFTTIRDNPWPVGVPIMFYNWSGTAYRSQQIDVCPVIVLGFWPIQITRMKDGVMRYDFGMENSKPLHETEGFESREKLDDWFRQLVESGSGR